MKNYFIYLSVFILLCYSSVLSAASFSSVQDGDWTNPATWGEAVLVPGAGDDVTIDGDNVTITTSVTVNSITLTNASNTDNSIVTISGNITVTISNYLVGQAENFAYDVEMYVNGNAIINVGGNVTFVRSSDNIQSNKLLINLIDNADVNISGTFTFNYQNASITEVTDEITLGGSASLSIDLDAYLYIDGGTGLNIDMTGTSAFIVNSNLTALLSGGEDISILFSVGTTFQIVGDASFTNSGGTNNLYINNFKATMEVGGDLSLISNTINKLVYLEVDNSPAVVNVDGNISLTALSEGDVTLDLGSSTNLNIKGGILRPNNYGSLVMAGNATLSFVGTSAAQTIPANKLPSSGTDSLDITNLVLNNTSGQPFTLAGPLFLDKDLNLTAGIIETSSANMLTLLDDALITGGSENAYIDGPVTKIGGTGGVAFVFPVGDNGIYAPIEMGSNTTNTDQYTAQYVNNIPSDRGSVNEPLKHISAKEHWTFSKTTGSTDVNITIHWKDAARSGINDINDLVIAMYDVNAPGMGWKSIGQGNYGGSVSANDAGWIVNDLLCPPPIEDGIFTFGSTDDLVNPLPAEILEFTAHKMGEKIMVQWLTTSERNIDNYEVERSTDGVNFEMIKKVRANNDNSQENVYHMYDELPANGTNYYRLKQVDKDRSYEYSSIVIVKFYNSKNAILQPNPVIDFINLVGLDTEKGNVEVRIFSMDGRLVYLANIAIQDRALHIPVNNILALQSGTYILQYSTENGPQSIKFAKE